MASKKRKAEKRLARQLERVVDRTLCFWLLVASIREQAATHHEEWRFQFLADLNECDTWSLYDGLTRDEIAKVIDTIDRSLSWDQIPHATDDRIKGLFSWEPKAFHVPT